MEYQWGKTYRGQDFAAEQEVASGWVDSGGDNSSGNNNTSYMSHSCYGMGAMLEHYVH